MEVMPGRKETSHASLARGPAEVSIVTTSLGKLQAISPIAKEKSETRH